MKILFVHLSDIHIQNEHDWSELYTAKISDALSPQSIGSIDKILLLISGDITYSGEKLQYSYASRFIYSLIEQLKNRVLSSKLIHLFVVPGNHDNSYKIYSRDRQHYESAIKGDFEKQMQEELLKESDFLSFSSRKHSLNLTRPLFSRSVIEISGFKLEINMLNSAPFSIIDSDDKGLHVLPDKEISKLISPSGADMAVTLMHHSYQWFNECCKARLEQALLEKNTMLFVGHEHYSAGQEVSYNGIAPAHIFCGGCLSNKGDWTNSCFLACVYDTQQQQYVQYTFNWNTGKQVYMKTQSNLKHLAAKSSVSIPKRINESFVQKIMRDSMYALATDLSDYYVFPRMVCEPKKENEKCREITNFDVFCADIEDKRRIEINGADSTGKSALLKMIFNRFIGKRCVILCRVEDITSGNRRRIIRSIFEETYGEDPADYSRFEQLGKDEKMILIDDLHLISSKHISTFLNHIEDEFGYVIYSTNNTLELNAEERIKSAIAKDSFEQYRISPFFIDKRRELVNKVIPIKFSKLTSCDQATMADRIIHALEIQRKYIPLTPAVILQFIEYYSAYQLDAIQNDGSIFGKVFESSITSQLNPFMTGVITVDKAFVILGKIAYYIHSQKCYPISTQSILDIIEQYTADYGGHINGVDFIANVVAAKILCVYGCQNFYKFTHNNYLAYFIALEIRDSKNRDAVANCLEYACFGINSTILMFLTYITNDLSLIEVILNSAIESSRQWTEYIFGMPDISYLNGIVSTDFEISEPDPKYSGDTSEDLEKDRQEVENGAIDVVNVYDYREEEISNLDNQLIRSISLLTTIARCLPNFEHNMLRSQKEKVVRVLYELPNKIFYAWAKEVEAHKDELLRLICALETNEFTRKKITDADARRILQWDSISLLLELYYGVVNNAYRENTFEFLCDAEWNDLDIDTHRLEYLTVLEKANAFKTFYGTALKMNEESKSPTAHLSLSRVVHHFMLRAKLSGSQIQQLEASFFNPKGHSSVIVQRKSLENKK